MARREYGICSLLEDDEGPLEIALSVIGAGSSSPIDGKGMVSEVLVLGMAVLEISFSPVQNLLVSA